VDFDDDADRVALNVELGRLRGQEATVSRHLERARHRAGLFPSDFVLGELRKLTIEHSHLVDKIQKIEDELRSLARSAGD
jgi:hypothetical protein